VSGDGGRPLQNDEHAVGRLVFPVERFAGRIVSLHADGGHPSQALGGDMGKDRRFLQNGYFFQNSQHSVSLGNTYSKATERARGRLLEQRVVAHLEVPGLLPQFVKAQFSERKHPPGAPLQTCCKRPATGVDRVKGLLSAVAPL
jgi:hypothetical protein